MTIGCFSGLVELLATREQNTEQGIFRILDVRWRTSEKKETWASGEVVYTSSVLPSLDGLVRGAVLFVQANRLAAGGVQKPNGEWEHKIRMYGTTKPLPVATSSKAVPVELPNPVPKPDAVVSRPQPDDPFAQDDGPPQEGGFATGTSVIAFNPDSVSLPE